MNMPTSSAEISLSEVKKGETVVVSALTGGKHFLDKLVCLGILPGAKIELIQPAEKSPLIIGVNQSRFMIGHGMAEKILVRRD